LLVCPTANTIAFNAWRLSVKANKNEWHIIATTILSLECECKKEFQVTATSLKKAVTKAEKILGAEDLEWKIRAAWWLDPGRTMVKSK